MRKLIAIWVFFAILPFFTGCVVVEKKQPAKETTVIVVPAKKDKKHEDDKVVMCEKGKEKMVKAKDIDKHLKKGAKLGPCN